MEHSSAVGVKSRGVSINSIQKEMLLELVQSNPELLSSKFTAQFTHKMARTKWAEISTKLNAVPNGACKEWDQWRKTWQDLKKNAKAKASKINRHMRETGGGEQTEEKLDSMEEEIVELMCPTLISGHEEVPESLVIPLDEIIIPADENGKNVDYTENIIATDHTYAQAGPSKEATKAYNTSTPPKNIKTPRINRIKRLQSSINASQQLVQISATQRDIKKDYYAERIALMQEEQKRRRAYEEKKIAILQATNATLKELLQEVKELVKNNK